MYSTASQMMTFSVGALPGRNLSGVRGRAGSVRRATIHEGHAQQTGRRLTVLLLLVHVVLSQASHEQTWAARLVHHLIWVKSRKCLERARQRDGLFFRSLSFLSDCQSKKQKVDIAPPTLYRLWPCMKSRACHVNYLNLGINGKRWPTHTRHTLRSSCYQPGIRHRYISLEMFLWSHCRSRGDELILG